jgi:hypothetical protein
LAFVERRGSGDDNHYTIVSRLDDAADPLVARIAALAHG